MSSKLKTINLFENMQEAFTVNPHSTNERRVKALRTDSRPPTKLALFMRDGETDDWHKDAGTG
jgi:hypothetical protein